MAVISFQYLRELQKKERDSPALQQLDKTFYSSLFECIRSSNDTEIILPIARCILDMRERKVVSAAIKSARADVMPKNILGEEEALFRQVSESIKNFRACFEAKFLNGTQAIGATEDAGSGAQKARDIESPAGKQDGEQDDTAIEEQESIDIRALIDIPAFIGEDMKAYGPLTSGQTAKIPKRAAKILLDVGSAEPVS